MRTLEQKELKKRGCCYCTEYVTNMGWGSSKRNYCKHDVCPFHKLDNYETYKQYLKENPGADLMKLLRK